MSLAGCTIVLLLGGGFVEHSPSPNVEHLRATGARVIVQPYPLNSVPAAYASVYRPRSVLLGESAGGSIAAWAAHGRARAAVTVGAPFDFRSWQPDHPGLRGQPWRWSPLRVYHGQRPLTAIQWTLDPFVHMGQAVLPGARQVFLPGAGHHNAPRAVLIRELRRACATPPAGRRAGSAGRV